MGRVKLRRIYLVAISVTLLASVSPVSAQHESDNPVVARISSPRDEDPSPTIISAQNIGEFETVIVPELLPLVKSGDASLASYRSLRAAASGFDESWETVSATTRALAGVLESSAQQGAARGFMFASASEMIDDSTLSLIQKGERILWNMQAVSAYRASFGADFTLTEFHAAQGIALRGTIDRVVPKRFRAEDKTGQMFRERLRVQAPAALRGLAWLTFRFFGAEDDVVWVYSPAIKKTRPVTSTNRSDPFLDSPLAVEDIFGFSGKIQSVEAGHLSQGTFLAPVASLDLRALTPGQPGCYSLSQEKKQRTAPSLQISGKELGGNGALGEMIFVPRKLVRIELLQRDPYSLYGRQVLYVDAELSVPFYKFVYERTGALKKTVVTTWGLAGTSDAKVRTWLPGSTYISEPGVKKAANVSYDVVRFCEQSDSTLTLAEFDPKGLTEPEKKVAAAEVTPAVKVSPVPHEEVKLRAPAPTAPTAQPVASEAETLRD